MPHFQSLQVPADAVLSVCPEGPWSVGLVMSCVCPDPDCITWPMCHRISQVVKLACISADLVHNCSFVKLSELSKCTDLNMTSIG